MSDQFILRRATEKDFPAVKDLIFDSTNDWYQKNFKKNVFGGNSDACSIFIDVYESLDPGCCVVAEDLKTGKLAGSCFFHPRETHLALGIMNAHPDYFGMGVAKMILKEILSIASEKKLPVRLVSSAMNLDSFSLYTKVGFVPQMTFQDMTLNVPLSGLEQEAPEEIHSLYLFQFALLCLFNGLEFGPLPIDVFLGLPFVYCCSTLYAVFFLAIF